MRGVFQGSEKGAPHVPLLIDLPEAGCNQDNVYTYHNPERISVWLTLDNGSVWFSFKQIFANSSGVIFSQALSQGGTMWRNSILARSHGRDTAAAASAIGPMNYMIATGSAGAMRASAKLLNASLGDHLETGRRWRSGILYAFSVGVFACIPAYISVPYILPVIGNIRPDVIPIAVKFNLLVLFASPFTLSKSVNRMLFVATEKQTLMTAFAVLQAAVMAPSSYFLNKVAPVYGVSAGKLLGGLSCFFATMSFLCTSKGFRKYHLSSRGLANRSEVMPMIKEGTKNAFSYMIETLTNLSMMMMMSHIGEDALIANNIASQAIRPFSVIAFCFAVGLQRHLKGNHNFAPFKAALLVGFLLYATMFLLLPFIKPVASCFIDVTDPTNETTLNLVKDLITIQVIGGVGDIFRNMFDGFQQHFGHNGFTLATTFFCRGVIAQGLSLWLVFYNGETNMRRRVNILTACQVAGMICGGLMQVFKSALTMRAKMHEERGPLLGMKRAMVIHDHGRTRQSRYDRPLAEEDFLHSLALGGC